MNALRRYAPLVLLAAVMWGGVQLLRGCQDERSWQEVARAAAPGDIVMLSSETCAFCQQARVWLTERRVPFRECFIERDAGMLVVHVELGGPPSPAARPPIRPRSRPARPR